MIIPFALVRLGIWVCILRLMVICTTASPPDWVATKLGSGTVSHMVSNLWPVRVFNFAMNGGFPKADVSLTNELGGGPDLIAVSQTIKEAVRAVRPVPLPVENVLRKRSQHVRKHRLPISGDQSLSATSNRSTNS